MKLFAFDVTRDGRGGYTAVRVWKFWIVLGKWA